MTSDDSSAEDDKARRLLEFFGVRVRLFFAVEHLEELEESNGRLLCSAERFARLLEADKNGATALPRTVQSVFVYPGENSLAAIELVRLLCESEAAVTPATAVDGDWRIAEEANDFGGSMQGVKIEVKASSIPQHVFEFTGDAAAQLIFAGKHSALLKLYWHGVPIFVASEGLIDIDAELTATNFDIRERPFSTLPIVSYIRWAFKGVGWRAAEASACVVIDDPLLKPRYGFVRFRKLLDAMKQHRFTTSIAFIPWNWRRSDRSTVKLFADNSDELSLCIHGCDHTAGEFGTTDRARLHALATRAMERMSEHELLTGLRHDRVMVFPQGVFSEESVAALKTAGFVGVVNTEVHSKPAPQEKIRIRDVWDVAIMSYDNFPVFTRRYPAQGVENFAFDVLLGKPCLIVIHHDYYSDGGIRLVQLIDKLNALSVPLVWRRLGDVVRQSHRQRDVSSTHVEAEMYGTELFLANLSSETKSYSIRRRENCPDRIATLQAGSHVLKWELADDGYVAFRVDLAPGETSLISLRYKDSETPARKQSLGLKYAAKTMARRLLSEARDNYLAPAKRRIAAFPRS